MRGKGLVNACRLEGTDGMPTVYVGYIINRSAAEVTDLATGLGNFRGLIRRWVKRARRAVRGIECRRACKRSQLDRLTGLSVGSWFLDDARSFVRCGMGQGTVPLSHPCPVYTRRAPWRGLFSLARVSVAFWLVGAVGAGAGAAARGIGTRAATCAGATAAAVVGTAARGPAAGADDQVHRLAGIKFRSA